MPFHFLPGNGRKSDGRFIRRIVCTKNSKVAGAMVSECILRRDLPYGLHRLGVTMHVYADSAVVYGTASLDFQGRPIDERFVRVWVKNEAGRWQVVLFQATEIE